MSNGVDCSRALPRVSIVDQMDTLESIVALGAAIRREPAPMHIDSADLKAKQVRLDTKSDQAESRVHGDREQGHHETAFFTAKGRTDH